MARALDDVIQVTGGGMDEQGRFMLSVLTRIGGPELLKVTPQAASDMLVCLSMAVLGRRMTGTA